MKIDTPTEFLAFSDGKCAIYEMSGNKLAGKVESLDFGERTVGMKRLYAARSASSEITRLIHVPLREYITAKHNAVIDNTRFKIDAVQHLRQTNPPVTVLTLINMGAIT